MGDCFDRGSFLLRTMAGLFVQPPAGSSGGETGAALVIIHFPIQILVATNMGP